ncbi:MAG: hypothetical protein RL095_1888 [Verrucomicrobiota bacterium]|jgi:hypothetical protein
MKTPALLLSLGLLLSCATTPAEKPWTELKLADFHSLGEAGLKADSWVEKDGVISWNKRGAKDLISTKSYGDFELELEWNIAEGGNSGIFFRGDAKSNPYYQTALEMQVLDNVKHPDNKIPSHLAGSLYDMIAADPKLAKPAGEWNQVRILCKGTHIETWLNGVKTAELDIGSDKWQELLGKSKFKTWKGFGTAAAGPIGLQDHGDKVSYRKIRIREL